MWHARTRALILSAAVLLAGAPASAQVVQGLHIGGGVFAPKGFDSRVDGDVLVRDAYGQSLPDFPELSDALVFEMSDFRSGHLFAEWTLGFGDHVEVAAGTGFYKKTVPTIYYDLVDEAGREIEQELGLRIVPLTATVRFLPIGHAGDFQPYVGAGIGAFSYRYTEQGRFVDPITFDIYEDRYTTTGWAPGGLVFGGVRIPLGGDIYGLTLGGRYQFATGKTGGLEAGFLDEKIDLGGASFDIGFLVRF
jgi:hypothetical protein